MEAIERTGAETRVNLVARLAAGLAQGLALYFLYAALEDKTWPSNNGFVFAPLLFLASYVPIVLILSVGNLRIVTLTVWTLAAAAIVMALAWYDIWHGTAAVFDALGRYGEASRALPSFALAFFLAAALFIAHSLVVAGDCDRRFVADYATYFDVAWKLGLQLFLATIFVIIFWCVLLLGAELFNIIGIDFFQKLIEHRWFYIPATTLAQAAAIHLTDVRAGLVRGTRTLVLVLLSWLLPLMTIIAAGFLGTLGSTSLAPLWNTGFAAGYLLIAAGVVVFLINAAYQDGAQERQPHLILRYSGTIASVLLLPLVALSGYAVYLRVAQYGWTTSRVASTACVAVAACYAIGYALAIVPFEPWLTRVARWNVFTALFVVAVIGAIFSPLADPTRISVDSQVARVIAGKIDPEKFDYGYLRWDGGRFGIEALRKLAVRNAGAHADIIRKHAKTLLAQTSQFAVQPAQPLDIVANTTVYPRGRSLPKNFVLQDWNKVDGSLPPCMRSAGYKCDAYIFDFAGDGHEEIAVIGESPYGGGYPYSNGLFAEMPSGSWQLVGRPDATWACAAQVQALQSGKAELVSPEPPAWRDMSAAGKRLTILPLNAEAPRCPK